MALRRHGHLHGTLSLPSGDRVVCGVFASSYENVDELILYLPLGALSRAERRIGSFPFGADGGAESLEWRAPIDQWLAGVAGVVHADVPLRGALIGFEVDEDADVTAERRYAAALTPVAEGLDYRPANA